MVRDQSFHIDLKSVMPFICIGYGAINSVIYLLIAAETLQEYFEEFYPFTTATMHFIGLFVFIAKRKSIFRMTDTFEHVIGPRKQ